MHVSFTYRKAARQVFESAKSVAMPKFSVYTVSISQIGVASTTAAKGVENSLIQS